MVSNSVIRHKNLPVHYIQRKALALSSFLVFTLLPLLKIRSVFSGPNFLESQAPDTALNLSNVKSDEYSKKNFFSFSDELYYLINMTLFRLEVTLSVQAFV